MRNGFTALARRINLRRALAQSYIAAASRLRDGRTQLTSLFANDKGRLFMRSVCI
jgi:hypothetical protein